MPQQEGPDIDFAPEPAPYDIDFVSDLIACGVRRDGMLEHTPVANNVYLGFRNPNYLVERCAVSAPSQ